MQATTASVTAGPLSEDPAASQRLSGRRWAALNLGLFLAVMACTSWLDVLIASRLSLSATSTAQVVPQAVLMGVGLVILGVPVVVVFLGAWYLVDRHVQTSRAAAIAGSLTVGVVVACAAMFPAIHGDRFQQAYLAFLPTWLLFGVVARGPSPLGVEETGEVSAKRRVFGVIVVLGAILIGAGSLLGWSTFESKTLMYFEGRDGLELGHGILTLLAAIGLGYIGGRAATTGVSHAFGRAAVLLAMFVLVDVVVALQGFAAAAIDPSEVVHFPEIGIVMVATGAVVAALASVRLSAPIPGEG